MAAFLNKSPAGVLPAGYNLIEVIVALFVFSVGLLGVAGLQILSLQLSNDSYFRTVAAELANDMVDRMRANPSVTSLGINSVYNNPTGTSTANPNCLGLNASGQYANVSCTPTQMAGQDFYEWLATIEGAPATGWHPAIPSSLPDATGIVCIDHQVDFNSNDEKSPLPTPANPRCSGQIINNKPVYAVKIWWKERSTQQGQTSTEVQRYYYTTFSP